MTEAILSHAQTLYREGCEIVTEEVKLRQKSSGHIVRLAAILADLYKIFEGKNPSEKLMLVPRAKAFTNFKECMLELLRPLELGERMGFYYLSIGRHLLGKIPEAELKGLPFEKVKQLDRVVRAKGEVPAKLMEQARDTNEPATRLRERVDVMLFRGAPDHSGGPRRSLVLVAGKKLIDAIEGKIPRLRPAVTDANASLPASDAQVVDFALADCLSGIQAAEDHDLDQLKQGKW